LRFWSSEGTHAFLAQFHTESNGITIFSFYASCLLYTSYCFLWLRDVHDSISAKVLAFWKSFLPLVRLSWFFKIKIVLLNLVVHVYSQYPESVLIRQWCLWIYSSKLKCDDPITLNNGLNRIPTGCPASTARISRPNRHEVKNF
jgi:hypothetical protein